MRNTSWRWQRTSRPGPQPGRALADYNSPAQHAPPAVFEPATRRLDDVGRAFIEVCPRRRGLPDHGFLPRRTPTNRYELLPNLVSRRPRTGPGDAIKIRSRTRWCQPGITSRKGSALLSRPLVSRSRQDAPLAHGWGSGRRGDYTSKDTDNLSATPAATFLGLDGL